MSEVKVNKISPASGTTFTVGDSGDTFNIPSGVTLANSGTVTGLPASAINSGTLADARIPDLNTSKITAGTLDVARVPDLNASKITAGTIATARLGSGTASSSTFLRGDSTYAAAGGGIEMADQYRITANRAGNGQLNSNWERSDTYGAGFIGTGMTESSGVFSFPSTGIYFITAGSYILASNSYTYGGFQIQVTTDNSSYNTATEAYSTGWTHGIELGVFVQYIFDVTNTSNDKFRINGRAVGTNCTFQGSTSSNKTWVSAIRLGDT